MVIILSMVVIMLNEHTVTSTHKQIQKRKLGSIVGMPPLAMIIGGQDQQRWLVEISALVLLVIHRWRILIHSERAIMRTISLH